MARYTHTSYCCILLLMVTGMALYMTSLATSFWRSNRHQHEGILYSCISDEYEEDGELCVLRRFFHHQQSTEFEVSRLLLLGAAALLLIAFLLKIISPCVKKKLCFAISVIDTIAFLSMATGLSLYTYDTKQQQQTSQFYQWNWSFFMAWSGFGFYALGLISLLLVQCISSNGKQEQVGYAV